MLREGWRGRWHSAPCRTPRMSCCAPVHLSPPEPGQGPHETQRDKAGPPMSSKPISLFPPFKKRYLKILFSFPRVILSVCFSALRPPAGEAPPVRLLGGAGPGFRGTGSPVPPEASRRSAVSRGPHSVRVAQQKGTFGKHGSLFTNTSDKPTSRKLNSLSMNRQGFFLS